MDAVETYVGVATCSDLRKEVESCITLLSSLQDHLLIDPRLRAPWFLVLAWETICFIVPVGFHFTRNVAWSVQLT